MTSEFCNVWKVNYSGDSPTLCLVWQTNFLTLESLRSCQSLRVRILKRGSLSLGAYLTKIAILGKEVTEHVFISSLEGLEPLNDNFYKFLSEKYITSCDIPRWVKTGGRVRGQIEKTEETKKGSQKKALYTG